MFQHVCSIARRLVVCAAGACLLGALATPVAFAQSGTGTPLILNFNTASLGTFPTVSGSTYGVWSNGQTVSDTNVYVSFAFSAAGLSSSVTGTNFYAVIGGTSLRWSGTVSSGTIGAQSGGGWYMNDVLSGTGVMSPAFSVADMNASGGSRIYHLQGQNIYIEYGQNTIGSGTSNWAYVQSSGSNTNAPPPSTVNPLTRFSDVEMTYVPGGLGGGNNNADLTAINNIGSALGLIYTATTNAESKVTYKGYTQDLLPHLQTLTSTSNLVVATTQSGTPSAATFGGTGTLIAGILSAAQSGTGPTTISNGNFLASYPAYIQNVLTGTLGSPLLTNQPGGPNPTATALQHAQGFTGPGTGGSGTATQQVSFFFRPTFTPANQTYDLTLTGSIVAVLGSGSTATMTTYGTGTTLQGAANPLTINVSNAVSGTANQGFYGYLANGNVNNSVVTLGGDTTGTAGWRGFSNAFWQGGENGRNVGSQGGPSLDLITGALATSGTTDSKFYGQIIQRALGDLQELLMVGAFGNPSIVTVTGTDYSYTGPLALAPSQNVWSEKSNAYLNLTGSSVFNPLGKYLWENSLNVSASGTSAGAIYSNPYDDRFSNDGAVTLALGDYGGTLTIDLREIPVVPEPSAVALLSVAGAMLGGLAWRRRGVQRVRGRETCEQPLAEMPAR
jgi:hypothetical protein